MLRSGTASLPLHSGRVPAWLATRMARLGAALTEVIVQGEGAAGFLRRLADPCWFQAFGAVLGMDWHSSGITTSVIGALKRGLATRSSELGLHVCGGRGRHSRRTPDELLAVGEQCGLDGAALARSSRLVAKVDSCALQDGSALYLHAFVVSDAGDWVVVQQGMNTSTREARRYHWRSQTVQSFVEEPHAAVVGAPAGIILNFTDRRARPARGVAVELAQTGPAAVVDELRTLACDRHAQLPAHHAVLATDIFLRRLHGVLALAATSPPAGFEELLLTRGVGPRTMQALALVAEVAHGAPARFDDPARFAFAHGGKDGHPHPVPLRVYDQTIEVLRRAIREARLGRSDKLDAFRRLDAQTRELEQTATGPSFEQIVDREWQLSPAVGGMTCAGPVSREIERQVRGARLLPRPRPVQLALL